MGRRFGDGIDRRVQRHMDGAGQQVQPGACRPVTLIPQDRRAERWRRIAHEAAQQSRRSDVPLIHEPTPLAARLRANSDEALTHIVLAEQERTTTLRNILEETLAGTATEMPTLELAIGPEGGWAPEEEALFDANGWRAASLGPRILRAETAAIAALAVVASYLE